MNELVPPRKGYDLQKFRDKKKGIGTVNRVEKTEQLHISVLERKKTINDINRAFRRLPFFFFLGLGVNRSTFNKRHSIGNIKGGINY